MDEKQPDCELLSDPVKKAVQLFPSAAVFEVMNPSPSFFRRSFFWPQRQGERAILVAMLVILACLFLPQLLAVATGAAVAGLGIVTVVGSLLLLPLAAGAGVLGLLGLVLVAGLALLAPFWLPVAAGVALIVFLVRRRRRRRA